MNVFGCMYACEPHVSACGDQKKVSDPLELESETVVSHHVLRTKSWPSPGAEVLFTAEPFPQHQDQF